MDKELIASKDFFMRRGDEFFVLRYMGDETAIGVEAIYQYFKARMLEEMGMPKEGKTIVFDNPSYAQWLKENPQPEVKP